jgi:endoglucanase
MRRVLGALAGAVLTLAAGHAAKAEISPEAQVQAMRRGVNILGYDPLWSDPAKARFTPRHFKLIREAGFDSVRINLQAFEHMDAQNRLHPRWFKTLDTMVEAALAQKLTVILDEHDFNPCGEDLPACKPRLTAFWTQVAEHYKSAPDQVVFELLNEPNRALNDETWNSLHGELLALVRKTNPTRNVIIGPAFWNSIGHLDALVLPKADRHLIATVHYYTPMEFTHQGAAWSPNTPKLGVTWGKPADRDRMKADFDIAQAWSKAHGRPLLLGEFGAYDKGDMASRVVYTDAAAREAEARGWAWSYWQFDSDFIVYDIKADRWVEPIRNALIPPKTKDAPR